MDDMLGKMGEILSDPESLKQLQELAQMLQQNDESDNSQENAPCEENSSESSNGDSGGFDFSMLLRVQELMGAMQNNDDDTKLLLALRPHLKEQRQKKVDQAVKMLKLYAVFSAVKENGLLQDFISQ